MNYLFLWVNNWRIFLYQVIFTMNDIIIVADKIIIYMQDSVSAGQISSNMIQIKCIISNRSNIRNTCSLRIFNYFCDTASALGFSAVRFCSKLVDYPIIIFGLYQSCWLVNIISNRVSGIIWKLHCAFAGITAWRHIAFDPLANFNCGPRESSCPCFTSISQRSLFIIDVSNRI